MAGFEFPRSSPFDLKSRYSSRSGEDRAGENTKTDTAAHLQRIVEDVLRQLKPIYEKLPSPMDFVIDSSCGSGTGYYPDDSCSVYGQPIDMIFSDENDDEVTLAEPNDRDGVVTFGSVQIREYKRTVGDHPVRGEAPVDEFHSLR